MQSNSRGIPEKMHRICLPNPRRSSSDVQYAIHAIIPQGRCFPYFRANTKHSPLEGGYLSVGQCPGAVVPASGVGYIAH